MPFFSGGSSSSALQVTKSVSESVARSVSRHVGNSVFRTLGTAKSGSSGRASNRAVQEFIKPRFFSSGLRDNVASGPLRREMLNRNLKGRLLFRNGALRNNTGEIATGLRHTNPISGGLSLLGSNHIMNSSTENPNQINSDPTERQQRNFSSDDKEKDKDNNSQNKDKDTDGEEGEDDKDQAERRAQFEQEMQNVVNQLLLSVGSLAMAFFTLRFLVPRFGITALFVSAMFIGVVASLLQGYIAWPLYLAPLLYGLYRVFLYIEAWRAQNMLNEVYDHCASEGIISKNDDVFDAVLYETNKYRLQMRQDGKLVTARVSRPSKFHAWKLESIVIENIDKYG